MSAPPPAPAFTRTLRQIVVVCGLLAAAVAAINRVLPLESLVPRPLGPLHVVVLTTVALLVALLCAQLAGERFRPHPVRVAAIAGISFLLFALVCVLFVQPVTYEGTDKGTDHVLVGFRVADPEMAGWRRDEVVRAVGQGWSELAGAWGWSFVTVVLLFVATYVLFLFSLVLAAHLASAGAEPARRTRRRSTSKENASASSSLLVFLLLSASALASPAPLPAQTAFADSVLRLVERGEELAARPSPETLAQAAALLRDAAAAYEGAGLREEAVRPLLLLGEITIDAGAPDSALAWGRTALGWAAEPLRPDASRVVGLAFEALGSRDSATFYQEAALAGYRVAARTDMTVETLVRLGGLYLEGSRHEDAIRACIEALSLPQGDPGVTADAHDRLSVAYTFLNDREGVLRHATEAARLRGPDDPLGQSRLGAAYFSIGDLDSAAGYLQNALALMDAAGDTASTERAEIHSNLGQIHALLAQRDGTLSARDSALHHLVRATSLCERVCPPLTARFVTGNAGWIARSLGDREAALRYLALAAVRHRESGDPFDEASAFVGLGLIHHQLAPVSPSAAAAYYDSADARLARVRAIASTDGARVQLLDIISPMYGDWALARLALAGEPGVDEAAAARAALAAVERGRAQALLTLVAPAAQHPGPGADLADEGRRLAETVGESGAAAGLVYAVTADTLLVWVVDGSGGMHLVRRAVSGARVAELVERVRSTLGLAEGCDPTPGAAGAAPGEALAELAALLLPGEVLSRLPPDGEVIVVPGGAIGLVPFAALPHAPSGEPLGIRYALRYAPSLAALRTAEMRPALTGSERARAFRAALVVGDPRMPAITLCGQEGFVPSQLQGAAESAARVSARLEAPLLTGASATETAVRQAMAEAPLVHLETHGFAYRSRAQARQSFIVLASGPGGGTGEDGLLTVDEIMDELPPLRAELVVLSACETGLGEAFDAEGVIGLPRALLARGARSTLVSLWPVGDQPTALLMQSFYHHWLDGAGTTRAEALRLAQRDLRAHPAYGHPRYWAAFQLIGAS
jgi:tetratricopeptide (TPR) repeat protein